MTLFFFIEEKSEEKIESRLRERERERTKSIPFSKWLISIFVASFDQIDISTVLLLRAIYAIRIDRSQSIVDENMQNLHHTQQWSRRRCCRRAILFYNVSFRSFFPLGNGL